MSDHIEIDVAGRWDALALFRRLGPYCPYPIQFEPERWLVRAEAPGHRGGRLQIALAAIEDCLRELRVEDASVRVDGQLCSPRDRGATG